MNDQFQNQQGNVYLIEEYRSRINRVMDYIESHLDQNLTLEELAGIALFSKYHFHRIFYALVGETLFQFIQRLRMERAAILLAGNPKMSITEIALECGYASSAAFARAFRNTLGLSASEYRKTSRELKSNSGKPERIFNQALSNSGKAWCFQSDYDGQATTTHIWRDTMKTTQVTVKDFPATTVAYVRHIGPYQGDAQLFERLFGKLMSWAGPRGLLGRPDTQSLIIYHDDPEITDKDKLRTSVCVTVPQDTQVDGEIGKMTIPPGKYAVARFRLSPPEYQEAWNWIYGEWLPGSGFQPDDRPCFELYPQDQDGPDDGKQLVDISIPVKPL